MNEEKQEATVFIKQPDGSLKPVEIPADIAEKCMVYTWMRKQGLVLDEIIFIISHMPVYR